MTLQADEDGRIMLNGEHVISVEQIEMPGKNFFHKICNTVGRKWSNYGNAEL